MKIVRRKRFTITLNTRDCEPLDKKTTGALLRIVKAATIHLNAIVPCGLCNGGMELSFAFSCPRCKGAKKMPRFGSRVQISKPRRPKITKMLTAADLPALGFQRSGNPSAEISPEALSRAIREWIRSADEYTSAGIPLPGFPTRERAKPEGLLASLGWFRAFPSRDTVLLKYPAPLEPEKPQRVKQDPAPHWSTPPTKKKGIILKKRRKVLIVRASS